MNDRVTRAADTAQEPTAFWSPAVHGLLRHLPGTGFPAPRVLHAGDGEYDTGTLTWIEGSSGADGRANVAPRDRPAALAPLSRPARPPSPDRGVFCNAHGIAAPENASALVAEQQRMVSATCADLARRSIELPATWTRDGHLAQLRARIAWTEASGR